MLKSIGWQQIGLLLFLAAAVVAVFAFCSIAIWVIGPARERQARDRLALLRSTVEQPGENAHEVLKLLIQEDEKRYERKKLEDQRGLVIGGLVITAVGVGLGVMLLELGDEGTWTVGLIPFLIGGVLVGAGLVPRKR